MPVLTIEVFIVSNGTGFQYFVLVIKCDIRFKMLEDIDLRTLCLEPFS